MFLPRFSSRLSHARRELRRLRPPPAQEARCTAGQVEKPLKNLGRADSEEDRRGGGKVGRGNVETRSPASPLDGAARARDDAIA